VALPAFAAAWRAVALCCCGAGHATIDRAHSTEQMFRTLLQRLNGTDGQTDGHRTVSFKPCSAYYVDSASNGFGAFYGSACRLHGLTSA